MLTHDFYFQNFFPKNLAKKLGRGLQWRISGTARVRVRFCSTPPPFRADEKHPRGSFPRGGFSRRGIRRARDRSLGWSIGGWLPVSCPVCHILATFDRPHHHVPNGAQDLVAGTRCSAL